MSTTTFVVDRDQLQVVMERTFNASQEEVIQAMTDPALITQWWGPANLTTVVDTMEVRPGGAWRFIQTDSEGNQYAFHGVYQEISPARLSMTFNFEGIPGDHEIVDTYTLEEMGAQTKVTSVSQYANLADLEGMIGSGMESGARESWDRLAHLVEKD